MRGSVTNYKEFHIQNQFPYKTGQNFTKNAPHLTNIKNMCNHLTNIKNMCNNQNGNIKVST